eukprot:scaffold1188_cov255-Pinguiococcus_pyrenoidosus.AAC.10
MGSEPTDCLRSGDLQQFQNRTSNEILLPSVRAPGSVCNGPAYGAFVLQFRVHHRHQAREQIRVEAAEGGPKQAQTCPVRGVVARRSEKLHKSLQPGDDRFRALHDDDDAEAAVHRAEPRRRPESKPHVELPTVLGVVLVEEVVERLVHALTVNEHNGDPFRHAQLDPLNVQADLRRGQEEQKNSGAP